MIKKSISAKLKNIPVYEHLDECLRCTYEERLQWLEEANEFVRVSGEATAEIWKKVKQRRLRSDRINKKQ